MSLKTFKFKYKILDKFNLSEHRAEFICQDEKLYLAMDQWKAFRKEFTRCSYDSIVLINVEEFDNEADAMEVTRYMFEGD